MGMLREIFQDMGGSEDVLFDCLIDDESDRKQTESSRADDQGKPDVRSDDTTDDSRRS